MLNWYNYTEYVSYHVDELKKYVGEPRKYEKYDSELFESWKKKGEIMKESYQKMDKKQRVNTPDMFAPQFKLTKEFVEYVLNKFIITAQSFYYYLCMGRDISKSWEYREFIGDDGKKHKASKPYFNEQIDSIQAVIDFIEVISGARSC